MSCCSVAKSCPTFFDPMDYSRPGCTPLPWMSYWLLKSLVKCWLEWGTIQDCIPPAPWPGACLGCAVGCTDLGLHRLLASLCLANGVLWGDLSSSRVCDSKHVPEVWRNVRLAWWNLAWCVQSWKLPHPLWKSSLETQVTLCNCLPWQDMGFLSVWILIRALQK